MNILVVGNVKLFDAEWKKRLNAPISDTGNALTDDEIMELSRELGIEALLAYRNAVGARTREIVTSLSAGDMKRKVSPQGLDAIRQAGGVTDQEDSLWLLDSGGHKDVAGLLPIPPPSLVILPPNDCCTWNQAIRAGQTVFRQA